MSSNSTITSKRTIKQAKADFKARGRPSLSEREQKQLERSIQLDKRAWGVKEREKKKGEAIKKKQERERREKEERERVRMGSQRRCDRFGYKSSQLHLGAFFGGGGPVKDEDAGKQEARVKVEVEVEVEDEAFGDDGVDDETLLDALGSPELVKSEPQHPQSDTALLSLASPMVTLLARSHTEPPYTMADELGDFWDVLGSSTQIARELASDEYRGDERKPCLRGIGLVTRTGHIASVPYSNNAARHKPPNALSVKAEKDRKLMPPPMLPMKARNVRAPVSTAAQNITKPSKPSIKSVLAPKHLAYSGFTTTELEDFVDDDLQLTQVAPG